MWKTKGKDRTLHPVILGRGSNIEQERTKKKDKDKEESKRKKREKKKTERRIEEKSTE